MYLKPKELVEAMSRHYRELSAEEIPAAQAIDKEIGAWAYKDYQADMMMLSIRRDINDRIKTLARSKNVDREELKEISLLLRIDPEMAILTLKKFYPERHGRTYEADHLDTLVEKYGKARSAGLVAQEQVYELNKQYTNWRRFWLVPGGHLHDEYNCSSCHKAGKITEMSWIHDLSGLTLEAAVDQYGKIICTICYPEAPTDWSSQVDGQASREEGRCSGSGKPDKNGEFDYRRRTSYGTCPDCDGRFVISPASGVLRAHKPYVDPYCEGSNKPPSEVTEKDFKGRCSVCNRIKYIGRGGVERHNKPKVKV